MPPHYKKFYPYLFEAEVKPTGLRSFFGWKWLPYFSGVQIDLELIVKPYGNHDTKVKKLDYNWRLINSDTNEVKSHSSSAFITSLFHKNALASILQLPYLVGKGQYFLEIEVIRSFSDGNRVIYEWEPVFDFELHSEDRFWFGLMIPIVTFVIGMLVLYLIQVIFQIKLF